jgi:hypothetical protein
LCIYRNILIGDGLLADKDLFYDVPVVVHPAACRTGVDEWILLQQIWHIIKASYVDNPNMSEDERCACISFTDLHNRFCPYWNMSTLKRVMATLRKQGLISVIEGKQDRADRTNCYKVNTALLFEIMAQYAPKRNQSCLDGENSDDVDDTSTLRSLTPGEQMQYNSEYDREAKRIGKVINMLDLDISEKQRLMSHQMERFQKKLQQKYDDIRRKR